MLRHAIRIKYEIKRRCWSFWIPGLNLLEEKPSHESALEEAKRVVDFNSTGVVVPDLGDNVCKWYVIEVP